MDLLKFKDQVGWYNPTVYDESEEEYQKLVKACELINERTHKNFTVDNIYFDMGQDWWWTTIVGDYQILTPYEQQLIVQGTDEMFDAVIDEISDKINKRGW